MKLIPLTAFQKLTTNYEKEERAERGAGGEGEGGKRKRTEQVILVGACSRVQV